MNGWKRREFTTKGNDPTVVVEWSHSDTKMSIVEFQGMYITTINGLQLHDSHYWENRHRQMESTYLDAMAQFDPDMDIRMFGEV